MVEKGKSETENEKTQRLNHTSNMEFVEYMLYQFWCLLPMVEMHLRFAEYVKFCALALGHQKPRSLVAEERVRCRLQSGQRPQFNRVMMQLRKIPPPRRRLPLKRLMHGSKASPHLLTRLVNGFQVWVPAGSLHAFGRPPRMWTSLPPRLPNWTTSLPLPARRESHGKIEV